MRKAQWLRAFFIEKPVLLSLVLAIFAILLVYFDVLWRWNWLLYDWNLRYWWRAPPEDVVIVAIDEYSLDQIGRWPWPRQIHAAVVDRLTTAGAKAIALDIIFAEPSITDPRDDERLAQAIQDSGRIILPVLPEQRHVDGPLIEILPIPALRAAAEGLGHVDVELDRDSIARSAYLKAGIGAPAWSALGLAVAELVYGPRASLPGQRNPGVWAADAWVRDYRLLLPFAGPPGHFNQISYADVLNNRFATGTFRDRIVLVGATATGLGDNVPTPVSAHSRPMSGVEFNANILDTVRSGFFIQPLTLNWRMALTGILALLPLFLYSVLTPRWTLLIAGLSVVSVILGSMALVRGLGLWFPPAELLLTFIISYPLWSWRRLLATMHSLHVEKERIQVTLHSIGDGVITTDAHGVVEYMNPIAETLTGFTLREAQGQPLTDVLQIVNEHSRAPVQNPVQQCLEAGGVIKLAEQSITLSRAGQEYAIRASAGPMRDETGQPQGAVLAISDFTEAHLMAQQLAFQANHDALTELPNRHLLLERLEHAVVHARHSSEQVAILFVDLDRFKSVNDGLGHSAGDALLKIIAARLQTSVSEDDTVARLGGDEFGVLLEHLEQVSQAVQVTQQILRILEEPCTVFGHEFFVTASIGIGIFPRDGESAEVLLKNAANAMSRAKESGSNTFQFYAQDMNKWVLGRLIMERDLRHALERHELELYYQPQLELQTGRIVAAESLLRWRHPELGLISPARFVPLAEETGLINPIGEWVIREACQQVKKWQMQGLQAPRVAVNLSPRQFSQRGISDRIGGLIREAELEPHSLDLEITESVLMRDIDQAIHTLRTLKDMGIQLALDDFGTGYSSFNYLKRFPVDWLKVDQSFVRDIGSDTDDAAAIVGALIAVAHSLRLGVIAEGVETEAQLDFLRTKQCELIQGFYISRPLPLEQMETLLRSEADQ
ncbi:MAG: EAL domain-containing protein [Candidatus Competibacteraceae bacterium]|jgi:diguanylate cyclase (GGDEF)-like protein/PAS domain S-box-containing protein|nr:EAL domain-containing protein [Candidatus Competibacteraceae bacterium]